MPPLWLHDQTTTSSTDDKYLSQYPSIPASIYSHVDAILHPMPPSSVLTISTGTSSLKRTSVWYCCKCRDGPNNMTLVKKCVNSNCQHAFTPKCCKVEDK